MKIEEIGNHSVYVVDAQIVVSTGATPSAAKFGIMPDQLGRIAARGKSTAIAQFYSIVAPGLILAEHIFRGLERPLCCQDNMKGDETKLVYSWKPKFDYEWKGTGFAGAPVKISIGSDKVFVVIVSPNQDSNFPEIGGWIEHWNWVHEDISLPKAPIDWKERYKEKLWSKTS